MNCIINYFFRNASLKTPLFDFNGKTKWGKVVKVYDGDTIHVVFYLDANHIDGNVDFWV